VKRSAAASPIAVNGMIDGLWLEGCMAGELFEEAELVTIALTSVEALLGETFEPINGISAPERPADAVPTN